VAEIETRLRALGCTEEQIVMHVAPLMMRKARRVVESAEEE
jgi:hypothetical protein